MVLQILRNIKAIMYDGTMPKFNVIRKECGILFALRCILAKIIALITDYRINPYNVLMEKYCKNHFASHCSEKIIQFEEDYEDNSLINMWTLWWQGEKNAPELVKVCLQSQKAFCEKKGINYFVIDKDNYSNYVKIPDVIMQKFVNGNITVTHFSDILRAELLKTYGGLWIDATILITGDLDSGFYSSIFYTNKKRTYQRIQRKIVSQGRWTGYFLKGAPHMPLFELMSDAFKCYWENHNELIDYYLIDYIISFGYDSCENIKRTIDSVPYNNEHIFDLNMILSDDYDKDAVSNILKKNVIHKLSYKNISKEKMERPNSTWSWIKATYSK